MGVRILVGEYDGTDQKAVMVDSASGFAFGPLFDDWDSAHEFVEWFGSSEQIKAAHDLDLIVANDPRPYPDAALQQLHTVWQEQREPQKEVLF